MGGIDVKRQTIPLSLRSSLITTMFTPWGCYRWTRLPLVISSASKERQRQIHMVLDGLLSFGITHGILIPGCSVNNMEARIDHDRSLIAVLEGFEQRHVKVNVNKMKFLICKATFMSHVTTTDGLQPNPVTVKAMITMPTPTEKQAVRRFLRDINYLAKFCSELSSVTQLHYNLTKEDMPLLWSTRHQEAFDSAKALATCAACLAYFDVTAPLILQVDASDYGQGAALLQTIKPHSSSALDESSLRPIAYCKRPNHYRRVLYLAIVEALNTFEELLLGKSNRVYTDHQLFQSIFKKDLALAPKCLQKMLLFLQRYNFTIVYRKGSLLNLADDLSRTHVKTKPSTHPCRTPSQCFTFILLAWTPTHWPSPIPLSSYVFALRSVSR